MPSYFKSIEDGVERTLPFNRFHLAEANDEPVKTKDELPGDVFELSYEQAHFLLAKWNSTQTYPAHNVTYSL